MALYHHILMTVNAYKRLNCWSYILPQRGRDEENEKSSEVQLTQINVRMSKIF